MNRKILIAALLVVGIIGYFIYSNNSGTVVEVESATLETRKVIKTVSASGSVKSISEVELALPATGTVQTITVKTGDLVEEGQYLGSLNNYDLYQSAQAAKDARDIALRDLDLYVENYGVNLSGVGGEDEYNIGLRRHDELISRSEAQYQSTLGTLNKTVLNAPFSGTVIDVGREVGEVAVAGTSLIKLADLENLVFEIDLDQEDFGQVEVGQKVEIVLDPYEDLVFTGEVLELPLFADETTEEFTVKIKVDQNDERPILLGMNGDADIIIEETQDEVQALSFDQLFTEDDSSFVWIVENELLKKMPVEIGLEGDIYTEIKTNLSGMTIVVPTSTDIDIEEGARVNIKE